MAAFGRNRWFPWLPAACLALAGCTQQDTESLARIGRKFGQRSQGTIASVRGQVDGDLRVLNEPGLKEKIDSRLRWDALLSDVKIEVQVTGGEVDLTGTVKNDAQRRRAAEIAESTAGVQAVNDRLKVEE
jgi:hypothetical protein